MSFFGKSRQSEAPPRISGETPRLQPAETPLAPPSPVGFETVLGANSTLEGALKSAANVRLDGTFTGTLEITGNVLVGETAKITADINAKNISIAGAVRGNVSGKKVQLLRTGRIWGDIQAQALTTEEGAFIDGKITMIGSDPTAPLPSFDAPVAPVTESTPSDIEDEQPSGEERLVAAIDHPQPEESVDEIIETPISPASSTSPTSMENGGASDILSAADESNQTENDSETHVEQPSEPDTEN